ncbi:uncharacterized protein GGS22DRAFT_173085 [Annulohypoxylon maeteangense]|uniref:uncharacterized protein n=1 Tax=Annulohypoxylon maeteangense TaxID=1927788 RepID=UPI002008DBCA|nr:uncharacterized protein GGS22DRAFT_173085 [Annulohypoxylon maeteangense]KAI0881393.1 hypothetical protein GGS22DRAFT_173085 [Annulohypoxylon maeteangense]
MSSPAGETSDKPANGQLNTSLKRDIASVEDYEIRVGPGWTLNDGTYNHIPQGKRRKRDIPIPSYVDQAHQAMFGLTSLQLAHNAPITPCAMDIATEHLWRCLPEEVQNLVEVVPPNGPDLWSADRPAIDDNKDDAAKKLLGKKKDDRDNMFEKIFTGLQERTYKYHSELKKKPWAIWPIWVEDKFGSDWLTIVWYSEETVASSGIYDRLRMYEVYDPRRAMEASDNGRCEAIDLRKRRIMTQFIDVLAFGGINTRSASRCPAMMAPMARGEHTSGERCFAAVKEMLNCILENYIDGRPFNPKEDVLPSLPRWVNPYQARIEMTGINAWVLMSAFDYNGRIVVECLEPEMKANIVVDGARRTIKPYALAGPLNGPQIADADYCTEPLVGEAAKQEPQPKKNPKDQKKGRT